MSRTLRGAWSRRGTLLPLLLLTVVVVAGAVTVIGFADRAGTSPMLAVPLLLLGAVAVPATGRELANARRGEIALARLRGLQGGRALPAARGRAAPGAAARRRSSALVLGGVGSWLADRAWVGGAGRRCPARTPSSPGSRSSWSGLVAVLLGMAGALREPLSDQVSVAARPARRLDRRRVRRRAASLVAAVVAVYRSSVASGDPDWVVLAGPALVGLAVGMLVVWLVRVGRPPRAWRRTATGSRCPASSPYAAWRASPTPPRRCGSLVAATVVAALALTGAAEVDDWTDDTARLRTGAPLQVAGGRRRRRRAAADPRPRPRRPLADGRGAGARARAASPPAGRSSTPRGTTPWSATSTPAPPRPRSPSGVAERSAGGDGRRRPVTRSPATVARRQRPARRDHAPAGPGRLPRLRAATPQRSAPGCTCDRGGAPGHGPARRWRAATGGCVVTAVTLARSPGDTTLPWVLTGLDFGGSRRRWPASGAPAPRTGSASPRSPVAVDEGLLAPADLQAADRRGGHRRTAPARCSRPTPRPGTAGRCWTRPGGDERPAEVVGRLPGAAAGRGRRAARRPAPRRRGRAADRAGRPGDGARPRPTRPTDVLAALTDAAGHPAAHPGRGRRGHRRRDRRRAGPGVLADGACFCVLVALLVLAAAVARQRAAWTREVAALRAVGVAQRPAAPAPAGSRCCG